jgi:uncharacterized protein
LNAPLSRRIAQCPWSELETALDSDGVVTLPGLLTASECAEAVALYPDSERFRSRVVMAQHGYGSGEYQYFSYPLPGLVATLRQEMYTRLVPLANRWQAALGSETRFPEAHASLLERCHAAGQTRPTPLLLRYGPGDYNRLHQDLYGAQVFPIQLVVMLSKPHVEFEGGELVLTEQRARMQSRPLVLTPEQGDAILFAVRDRPVPSKRGHARVRMRHGVSRLHRGTRHTLGIIFHDAT